MDVIYYLYYLTYRRILYINRTKFPNLNASRLVLQLSLPSPLKPGVQVENEDVVGAALTNAKVCQLVLEVWRQSILVNGLQRSERQ